MTKLNVVRNNELLRAIAETTLANRMDRIIDRTFRDNNKFLRDLNPPSYSRSERVAMRLRMYRNRISDAWLVLTGRAEIAYDD